MQSSHLVHYFKETVMKRLCSLVETTGCLFFTHFDRDLVFRSLPIYEPDNLYSGHLADAFIQSDL